jgi:hypothetical protein
MLSGWMQKKDDSSDRPAIEGAVRSTKKKIEFKRWPLPLPNEIVDKPCVHVCNHCSARAAEFRDRDSCALLVSHRSQRSSCVLWGC